MGAIRVSPSARCEAQIYCARYSPYYCRPGTRDKQVNAEERKGSAERRVGKEDRLWPGPMAARGPTAHVAQFIRTRVSRRRAAEVSDGPVLHDETLQLRFSRRFQSKHVERAFREHTFQVSKPRLAVILLIFLVVELYIMLASLAFRVRKAGFRAHGLSQYGPFTLLCCATLFLFSRWNNSRRLPYVMWPLSLTYVLFLLCPLIPAALQEGTSNMTLWRERYQEDVEAERERPWHDYLVQSPASAASWAVASW